MLENIPNYILEDMLDRMLNRMLEDILNRILEDLPVRKYINIMVGIIWNKLFFSWGLIWYKKNTYYFLKI